MNYTLLMDGEEVMIRANQLEFEGDEMEEGMNYYDEESLSFCGVEDFLRVLEGLSFFHAEVLSIRARRAAPFPSQMRNIAAVIDFLHLFP
ncbi:Uncharacterised protein family (UPF0231) [Serratia marcescens]|uniref:Uncharacterized protein n=1 Tax=Serratia marcescens TaxID=615 RepID=A0A379YJT3_SERMA|nr:Uncharacterised protein family (UPF0231) [Serratia marcescens]